MRRLTISLLFLPILLAQTKQPPTPADYGQWETLTDVVSTGGGGGGRGGFGTRPSGLSPDGKWLAYGINRSNGNNELRVANVADGSVKTAAFGERAAFSSDSKWIAYGIGYSESQADRMRKDKKPVQNKLGLLNLATGEQTTIDAIQSFAFSPNGAWLAMRHYPPEKAGAAAGGPPAGGDGASEDENPVGATLILRQLATGRDTTFGNVSEYAWQDLKRRGHLLAMAISTEDKTGNGVQLFDSSTGSIKVLDSGKSTYSGLAWRKDSADLAVLRAHTDDKHDGPTYDALCWTHPGEASEAAHVYDPTKDSAFPAGMRTVSYRKPAWTEDGDVVFLAVSQWYDKPASPKRDGKNSDAKDGAKGETKDEEEPPAVDIWHWRDVDVMAKQKKGAAQDRQRNMLAAWHVSSGKFVQLGHDIYERVSPLKNQKVAWVAEWKAYAMDRSIGRPAADLYFVDLSSGNRTKVRANLPEDHYVQASPGGKYLLYFEGDQYWTVNTASGAVTNISKNIKTSFTDKESDATIKQKPAFGVAGWSKNDADVILYDKFDLWRVTPDGAKVTQLTQGAKDQVRYRYLKLDPDEEFIDLDKPTYLSTFGIWSKQSGFARRNADGSVKTLISGDKAYDRLSKASDADVYQYVSQTFVESPNAYVAGPELNNAKRVTDTNAFQSKYAWSREELIEYKNSAGTRLQGALYYPAGYEPGKKYPMIVYMYEKLSDGLHHYSSPSERAYYNDTAFTSHGYFLLKPDIVFKPREPGLSVADCVGAAVKQVSSMGLIDDKKVGVIGHSWGGFDASFLSTRNMFAAAIAGAPITDLVSNYGNHHWSSGIAETDHIETGQQRMEVPLYEDLQAYIRNSAVFGVKDMTTPLLIEVGDADGTVFYHQGVEMYNIARRAKKNVVLLVYGSEDHGLRKKADQVDYQHRIFEWFGYYLKGDKPASWITDGQTYLDHQRELKKK